MAGKSQSQTASEFGVSKAFFSEWLNGKKEWSWELIVRVSDVTGLPAGIFTESRLERERSNLLDRAAELHHRMLAANGTFEEESDA